MTVPFTWQGTRLCLTEPRVRVSGLGSYLEFREGRATDAVPKTPLILQLDLRTVLVAPTPLYRLDNEFVRDVFVMTELFLTGFGDLV